jgi:DNA-binding transcriptional regulator LsrR (DeoR family)
MSRIYRRHNDIDDALLIEICQRFLTAESRVKIADWLTQELGREFSREAVYPQISRALRRGFIRLDPPTNVILQQRIADQFKQDRNEIHVIDARGEMARDLVADAAARHIIELIVEVSHVKKRVCIGLGGGGTVDRVARSLANYLRKQLTLPPLALHALTPGFDVFRPLTAPVSSLGYFDGIDTDIEYVGLFAPAVVPSEAYAEVTSRHGIVDSFDKAAEIDIVITSCARAADEHGELNRFMQVASKDDGDQTEKALLKAGWLADVTYRPYNEFGPISLDHGIRGVTLFELEDLVRLVRDHENKHVVLIAAPCGQCHEPKAAALRPLLSQPETLKLWNHLFLDTRTAQALMPPETRS